MPLYGTFLIIPNIADLLHLSSPMAKFAVTTSVTELEAFIENRAQCCLKRRERL